MIRLFTMKDYEQVYQLWMRTPGMGLRSLDDSREGIERFINRNPLSNFVAVENGLIIGSVLSGHDGRRGFLYHLCVDEAYRRKSIARQLLMHVEAAMKAENINKLALFCKVDNSLGNQFWNIMGWEKREDLNLYMLSINDNNT